MGSQRAHSGSQKKGPVERPQIWGRSEGRREDRRGICGAWAGAQSSLLLLLLLGASGVLWPSAKNDGDEGHRVSPRRLFRTLAFFGGGGEVAVGNGTCPGSPCLVTP